MSRLQTFLLGVLTFLLMLPETLPVPVLRGVVVERFGVSDSLATLFLVANMIGALIATPLVGLYVDRYGQRRILCVAAMALDAVLMQSLCHAQSYPTFLLLRAFEGASHLAALTLLMSLVADAAGKQRGRALGAVGAGLTFGVATGAAIGGVLGKRDPMLTLHIASIVIAFSAMLSYRFLPADKPRTERPGYAEVVRAMRSEPRLKAPLLLAFFDRFTVGFFTAGFPLMLAGVHRVEGPTIGMLLAAFLYPFALLSYPIGRKAEGGSRLQMVAIGSLIYGLAVCLVGVASVQILWILMPLCGVASAVMFIPTLLWLLDRAPGIGRSTAIAAFHTAGSLGFLLGPLCCGELIAVGGSHGPGYKLAFVVAGASELVGAAFVLRIARRTSSSSP